jgi:hypothetical protein
MRATLLPPLSGGLPLEEQRSGRGLSFAGDPGLTRE